MIGIANIASAEWVKAGEGKANNLYIDPSTIERHGNFVRLTQLFDFFEIQDDSISNTYYVEYDCSQKFVRILSIVGHSGRMGSGRVVFSSNDVLEWHYAHPDSLVGKLMSYVCEKLDNPEINISK